RGADTPAFGLIRPQVTAIAACPAETADERKTRVVLAGFDTNPGRGLGEATLGGKDVRAPAQPLFGRADGYQVRYGRQVTLWNLRAQLVDRLCREHGQTLLGAGDGCL